MFGSDSFAETLRLCRSKGLTLSQIQVLSILGAGPSTKSKIAHISGITLSGTIKCIAYLQQTGDIVMIANQKRNNRIVNIYGLSGQGKSLIGRLIIKKTSICPKRTHYLTSPSDDEQDTI